jgi:hypothetical protein
MKQFPDNNLLLPILVTSSLALSSMTFGEGLELKTTDKGAMIIGDDKTLQVLTTLPQTLMSSTSRTGFEINSSGDGDVVIDSDKTLDLEAGGKDVVVTGNRNTIHIHGDIPSLALVGRNNAVDVDRVGTIALVGAQNRVSYLGGLNSDQPTIDRVGADNNVSVRRAEIQPQPTATASSNQTNSSSDQSVVLNGSNQQRTETVDAQRVIVSGSNNQFTLRGRVQDLVVTGSNNDIKAENLGHVTFTGSNNLVEYNSPIETTVLSEVRGGSNNDLRRR